jgi:hypothetical protein
MESKNIRHFELSEARRKEERNLLSICTQINSSKASI